MGIIRRAADVIRGRNKPPSMKDILTGNLPARNRPPPRTSGGRQYSTEHQEAIARGDVPTVDRTLPYQQKETPAQVRARQEREQSRSPLFLEEIKRRLMGDRIGGQPTQADVERAERLHELAADWEQKRNAAARRREQIRRELEGKVSAVKRSMLALEKAGLAIADPAIERARDVVAKLTGQGLQRKLAGLGLGNLPSETVLSNRLPEQEGFRKVTPRQGQRTVAVTSSNVANVGWEPHRTDESIDDRTLGTLYIQFRNGWVYSYLNMPHWVYESALRAPSKGKWVWTVLRRGLTPDSTPHGSPEAGYYRIR